MKDAPGGKAKKPAMLLAPQSVMTVAASIHPRSSTPLPKTLKLAGKTGGVPHDKAAAARVIVNAAKRRETDNAPTSLRCRSHRLRRPKRRWNPASFHRAIQLLIDAAHWNAAPGSSSFPWLQTARLSRQSRE
jgi:hypothetical protein